ncbi:hypothetical protein J437_LFUL019528, partial [Ladona fulva]
MASYLKTMESRIFGLTIKDLPSLAYELAEKNGLTHIFNKETCLAGQNWIKVQRWAEENEDWLKKTSVAQRPQVNKIIGNSHTDPDEAKPEDFTEVDASVVTDSKSTNQASDSDHDDHDRENRANPTLVHYNEEELEMYSRYEMNHGKRGIALIFNNEKFKDNKLTKRVGAAKDGRTLHGTLSGLGFDVQLHNDKKLDD